MTEAPTLGEILAFALGYAEPAIDETWVESVCAASLVDELARAAEVDPREAYQTLRHIPDNLLHLLHSPEGWTALSAYIAGQLGADPFDYLPTVH